jgi:hypothetical protein
MPISSYKIAELQNRIVELPDKPNTLVSAQALKEYFDSSPEELRQALNGLIDNLLSVEAGDSGADNIGISAIADLNGTTVRALIQSLRDILKSTTDSASGADFVNATTISGLSGTTVQALLEALKAYIDTHKTSADHDGRYYTETEINAKVNSTKGAIASINNVANAAGNIDLVGGTGILISPDDVNNRITLTATGEMIPGAHAFTHAVGGEDELTPSAIGAATTAVYTATLDTTWSGVAAPYSKTVTVTGILATDTPIIDVVMSGMYATDDARIEAWGYVYRAVTGVDSITFYATDKPIVELPIQIKVVR